MYSAAGDMATLTTVCVCAQRELIAGLDAAAKNARLDGRPYPDLDFHVVMQTRCAMKPNTAPGTDGNVPEMWQALPLVLLITVWHLFRLRLSAGLEPVDDHWRTIDLTGIPKVRRPLCIGDFRFIAKTPTLQKWYLKCVLDVAAQSLLPSPLHVYGFRRGCCSGLVTELLRQCLHLAAQWAKPVYVMSLDIGTAFDDMRHGEMAKALNARGVHPNLVRAVMLEYLDLRVRVKLADADPTDYFSYSKAGRQGGVETPELFNIMMEALASALVASWRKRGFGFTLDGIHFVTHAVWADNWFLMAKSEDEARIMVAELTAQIYEKGFVWKPSSLECLTHAGQETPLDFYVEPPVGEKLHMKAVDSLVALGVLLDRTGSTEASVNHRMAQADKAFYKHLRAISNPAAGVQERLLAFMSTSAQALLYTTVEDGT